MRHLNIEPLAPAEDSWEFIEQLKSPRHSDLILSRKEKQVDEISLLNGVSIVNNFPTQGKLLDTAFEDLEQFFCACNVPLSGKYKLIFEQIPNLAFEEFKINIDDYQCTISASDSEGVRRAVYFLEDLILQADAAFIKKGIYKQKSYVKTRISRCFFGPLKRPPNYHDELLDEVDYYPDNYLAKLAYEGVNGLWLTGTFKDLSKTSITSVSKKRKKMLAKLEKNVKQCARYGIKIYLFVIEPISFDIDDPILEKYPELGGNDIGLKKGFCPWSDTAQNYLEQVTYSIFSKVPELGGLLCLSSGEWYTLCCNQQNNNCPRCANKQKWETMAKSLSAMNRGMKRAAPDAKLISWPYTQKSLWGNAESIKGAAKIPDDVILQHNFESFGCGIQQNKERQISDYWLSYIGPSKFFLDCAKQATINGTEIFAKLQVGCSHEVASVPFVPVPANLYRKYKKMRSLGVSGVMQCWYFGSYPSLMTKAAGMLSNCNFEISEDEFLENLAKIYWKNSNAGKVVKAWKLFSDAYDNYPLSNVFGYYGPAHDAISWPLHLKPVNRVLSPNWENHLPTSGDRFGCFLTRSNETEMDIEDAIELCQAMIDKWHKGLLIFRSLTLENEQQKQDVAVIEALALQFESALNIMKFYKLREAIAFDKSIDKLKDLSVMRRIVSREIENSKKLISLCKIDSRLGFNSEAEGYKYFPEKLRWRIDFLQQILDIDFKEYKKALEDKKNPYTKYIGEDTEKRKVITSDNQWVECAAHGEFSVAMSGAYPSHKFESKDKNSESFFRVRCDDENLYFEFKGKRINTEEISIKILLEPQRMYPTYSLELCSTNKLDLNYPYKQQPKHCTGYFEDGNESWRATITMPLRELKFSSQKLKNIPLNVKISHHLIKPGAWFCHCLCKLHPLPYRWIIGMDNPNDFAWLKI